MPLRLALLLLLSGSALAGDLYKWTDQNGQVHYSDQPPPKSTTYETREVQRVPDSGAKPAEPDTRNASPECLLARKNLRLLEDNKTVTMDLDGDGTPETLDEVQHAAQRERMQALVKQYCEAAAAEEPVDNQE